MLHIDSIEIDKEHQEAIIDRALEIVGICGIAPCVIPCGVLENDTMYVLVLCSDDGDIDPQSKSCFGYKIPKGHWKWK